MGTPLWVRISRNNPCQQAYLSKCRGGSQRTGWMVKSAQGREGEARWAGRRRESRDGLVQEAMNVQERKEFTKRALCFHIVHRFIQACKRSPHLYSTWCALILYSLLSFLHVRVWQAKKKKRPRASAETDSSQRLQQAQSSQANVYLHHTVPERRWHQSIPFWQGSWDNSWLWFPAITPANQSERHHDCREPQACVIRAYCMLQCS